MVLELNLACCPSNSAASWPEVAGCRLPGPHAVEISTMRSLGMPVDLDLRPDQIRQIRKALTKKLLVGAAPRLADALDPLVVANDPRCPGNVWRRLSFGRRWTGLRFQVADFCLNGCLELLAVPLGMVRIPELADLIRFLSLGQSARLMDSISQSVE